MADASRFPQLAYPFAVVGAAAGWLSAGLVDNPLIGFEVSRPLSAGCAAAIAALTGAILRRLCIGRRYWYEIGDPDPETRPWTDAWVLHVLIVVAAGAATGAVVGAFGPRRYLGMHVLGAMPCALAFVPVCLSVIAAARSAQRARLGSLVAATDRRAVWGILAALLAVTTLEALPDWPAWTVGEGQAPVIVLPALAAAAVATLAILAADRRALQQARGVIDAGLSERADDDGDPPELGAPRLDLGLGTETLAVVTRGAAAYRDRQRARALVKGSPEKTLAALEKAVRRGKLSLAVIAAAAAAQVAATTSPAVVLYEEERCNAWNRSACATAASLLGTRDPERARVLRLRARGEPPDRPGASGFDGASAP